MTGSPPLAPQDATPIGGERRICVVGAGPAGLMAALAGAERGRPVTLLDRLAQPGVRLLATGGGRCNLTNLTSRAEFMAAFGRQGRFMQPALERMGPPQLREFFLQLGVPTNAPDGLHVYPTSNSAATVRQALWDRCRQLRVDIRLSVDALSLRVNEGVLTGVETSKGAIPSSRVVLACGGKSCPELGGCEAGYSLAASAGHDIVQPVPALVPLVAQESDRQWLAGCAGVGVPGARVWIDRIGPRRSQRVGDVMIAHTGLSGPAVLDLSGEVAWELHHTRPVRIRLDFVPGTSSAQWMRQFDKWQRDEGIRGVRTLLSRHLPSSLAAAICRRAGLADGTRAAHLPRPQREALCALLTGLPVEIVDTAGFDHAMVTRGGVSLRQVNPGTLESKCLPGLHLAGELLDLAGPCGGYNLQWAFASGYLAGASAAK